MLRFALLVFLFPFICVAKERALYLVLNNATERPEAMVLAVHQVKTGQEFFRRMFRTLPNGIVELPRFLFIEEGTHVEVCLTINAYPEAHHCRTHLVQRHDVDVMAVAFPSRVAPPYPSVSMWDR